MAAYLASVLGDLSPYPNSLGSQGRAFVQGYGSEENGQTALFAEVLLNRGTNLAEEHLTVLLAAPVPFTRKDVQLFAWIDVTDTESELTMNDEVKQSIEISKIFIQVSNIFSGKTRFCCCFGCRLSTAAICW